MDAAPIGSRLIVLIIGSVIAAGCTVPGGLAASVGPAEPSTGQIAPGVTATIAPSTAVLTATDDGLGVTVTLAPEVASGATLPIEVVIHNGRSTPIVLPSDECGAVASMEATLPIPLEPPGKSWDGIAAEYKAYALEQGYRDGGLPVTAPSQVRAVADPCADGHTDQTLAAGETMNVSLGWTAALVDGIPALPGKVPFMVSVLHDEGPGFTFPPDYTGPVGGIIPDYQVLSVEGVIDVVGEAPAVVSAGEAIDVVLGDDRFVAWLGEQPRTSWAVANVYLTNEGVGGGPGAFWSVELFREPRNWAIGSIDATSGVLSALTFCPDPCDH